MGEVSIATDLDGRFHQFADSLASDDQFAEITASLNLRQLATIDGAVGSSCALTIAALAKSATGPLLVVCPLAADIDNLSDDLQLFVDAETLRFPAWQNSPGQRLIYDGIYGDRLRTLKSLMAIETGTQPIVVCSIQSLLQPVPPADAVDANTKRLQIGQQLPADELVEWLASHGFHGTSGVELAGEFARRGGIVDIFAPDWNDPVRIEWFDDEIESLRTFDVASQRSIENLKQVDMTILPAGGEDDMRAAERREQLAAYLPEDAWCVMIEPDRINQEAEKYLARVDDSEVHAFEETMASIGRFGMVSCGSLLTSTAQANMQLPTRTVERFSGDVKKVKAELEQAADEHDVYLVCQSEAEIQRLSEVFDDSRLREEGRLHFVTGRLSAGFHLVDEKALLLGGNELFRRSDIRRKVRKRVGKKIDSFLDLRNGDLVVHLVHGIGRYRGLERLKRENQVEDHLKIEFSGGTLVYVPATKIDLIQKYVGASKTRPRLATIGGALWQKRRKAAESAVTDMASELLEVQAQRAARPGIAFLPDTEWQREFDALFPYEETDDQLLAIDAIKDDMQKGTPMDRLLCGDVGFGKTEVSVRAAFKAIDNGYQVAVLVPTTILAEQHYRSFKERMAEFPFEIARLSRFCSTREEREIVEGLKEGRIDIVIGTHRLASKDVSFHNLGLLVIDEEQRFGVQVKERLKSLKSTVDVLTMTATPIPRTLHMAMTGMRDISNLHTPPEERVAVETRISRWNDELIRTAALRELNRGGQIYFVHNRVNDIETIRHKLGELLPEATIRVGHGQMHVDDLEEVMVGFVEHQFDILLATTIVESGLDIANANTIFIDQADMYGLSDLHQLRGRVGRYKHRAFCYLLIDEHKHITPEASRRLRAIEEFSQMGAGFAIAMRDLEFRGAGNILGTQQSGHIAAIGYELYCELLESAVRKLKRLAPKMKVDVNIDLPGEALLPDDYVPDLRMKIDMYRRMSRIASLEDVESLREELNDRFGRPPESVLHLLALAELKIDAAVWQVEMIRLEEQDGDDFVVLEYVDRGRIQQLSKMTNGRLRVVDDRCAYIPLQCDINDAPSVLAATKSVLRPS